MLLTCVTVNGENVIFVAIKYGISDPLSAVGLVAGLNLCNPSAFINTVNMLIRYLMLSVETTEIEVVKPTSSAVLLDGDVVHFVCEL